MSILEESLVRVHATVQCTCVKRQGGCSTCRVGSMGTNLTIASRTQLCQVGFKRCLKSDVCMMHIRLTLVIIISFPVATQYSLVTFGRTSCQTRSFYGVTASTTQALVRLVCTAPCARNMATHLLVCFLYPINLRSVGRSSFCGSALVLAHAVLCMGMVYRMM